MSELIEMCRQAHGLHVLVVDDDAEVRQCTVAFFKKLFDRVSSAANGEEALVLADSEHFDLLVSDLNMPGMTGWELARELKARQESLYVAILSGDIDKETECDPAYCDRLLQKPPAIDEIKVLLADLIQRHLPGGDT